MRYLLGFGVLVFLFYGCCGSVDCISGEYFYFRLLSKQDSSNLLFCNTKKYSNADLLLYGRFGNKVDTLYKNTYPDYYGKNSCDSMIGVSITNPYSKIYIQLDVNTIDSIEITYNFYNSKCCGDGFSITSFQYNKNAVIRDSTHTYNIYR